MPALMSDTGKYPSADPMNIFWRISVEQNERLNSFLKREKISENVFTRGGYF
jgi:hypothetical protein